MAKRKTKAKANKSSRSVAKKSDKASMMCSCGSGMKSADCCEC